VRVLSKMPYELSSISQEARLDKNENPYDPPPGMTEELRMALSSIKLNRYPDQEATALRRALSDHSGFPADWITVGNGGDELISYLMTAFIPPGGCLMTLSPSFSGYEHQSRALGVRTSEVPLEYRGGSIFLDTEKLIDRLAASSPDLVIIDRPNNPTGLSLPLDLLKEIASLTRGILAVDEAYVEFGGGSFLDVPGELPGNVFVLRTFSKAWGLAGLRVGWGVCRPAVREKIERIRAPFNVGVFPQEAARIALGYSEWMRARVGRISYTRDRFVEEVNRLPGWKAFPSSANFVLLHSLNPKELILKTFRHRGVHARFPAMGPLSEMSGAWVRVGIGLEEEMGRVLEALKDLSAGA